MDWTVKISAKTAKSVKRLPLKVQNALTLLVGDMERRGPVQGEWPNYRKLTPTIHHCHLKKGKPTYVAVWEVVNREVRLIEVKYAGTHEKAPY